MSAVVVPAPAGFGTRLTPTTATGSEFEVGQREMARSGAMGRERADRIVGALLKGNEEA